MHPHHPVISADWQVGPHADRHAPPGPWVPAEVPGAVQLDWARHQGWGPHTFNENWRDYLGLEDRFWTYRAAFPIPTLNAGERLRFRCRGVDYRFEIWLNGTLIHEQEGMFTPMNLDLTPGLADQNELRIVVHPAPKLAGEPATKRQARASCKPAVSYGWDWHPRLIPLGIWGEAELVIAPAVTLDRTSCTYVLEETLCRAHLTVEAELARAACPGAAVSWVLRSPSGEEVLSMQAPVGGGTSAGGETVVENPQLWWPHDQGEPVLYTLETRLVGADGETLDRRTQRFGFRRVRLVAHPTTWDEPSDVLKPRSDPPITLEVNGRRIFAKGTNWVPPEIFPGTVTAERYRELLTLARGTNFNLLRIWGGGIVNKPSFHELCDELGLMVWQEFPLACNNYPDDADYLQTLEQEAASIVTRLREHPSTVLWSGGNELFNAWSGMTDQSLALRRLNAVCLELDPHTPFIPTSPLAGWAHGYYLFWDQRSGREVFEWMSGARFNAYTEFGVPAVSPVGVLESFLPEGDRFPPREASAWTSHHGFGAWNMQPDSWLNTATLEHYFGHAESLPQLIAWTQWLQAEGYRFIYEEARRQKPRCSMALNWCYNDCWPCAANNSLVAYPVVPKPALDAVREACRPTMFSARTGKFVWSPGETLCCELFILNDAPRGCSAARVTAELLVGAEAAALGTWEAGPTEANVNQTGPRLEGIVPGVDGIPPEDIWLRLTSDDPAVGGNTYRLRYRAADAG